MNIFRKRKRAEADEGETENKLMPPKKTRAHRLFNWIKEKFRKKAVTVSETPEHRRTVRYILTPQAFSPSTVPLDLRDVRTFYELHSVVNVTESKNYEFKAAGGRYPTQVLPEHIRKYGSGFLNASGGVLLAGILDNGVVQGVPNLNVSYKRTILNIIDREFERFRPRVDKTKYSVNFVPVSYQQNSYERAYCRRRFVPNTYVIEIAVRQGDPGELYEDGLHQVFVRREGSVEGPLSPLKIKDLVLQSIKEVLHNKKRKRTDDDDSDSGTFTETSFAGSAGSKDKTGSVGSKYKTTPKHKKPPLKKGKISPIIFDLQVDDRGI